MVQTEQVGLVAAWNGIGGGGHEGLLSIGAAVAPRQVARTEPGRRASAAEPNGEVAAGSAEPTMRKRRSPDREMRRNER